MSTNTDDRNYDRDQNQQNMDRDQNDNMSYSSREDQDDVSTKEGPRDYSRESTRDIEMRWQEIENDYRRNYPDLTEDDLSYREGEFNTMLDRIANRTNRNRQEVQDEIWEWDSDFFDSEDDYDLE